MLCSDYIMLNNYIINDDSLVATTQWQNLDLFRRYRYY